MPEHSGKTPPGLDAYFAEHSAWDDFEVYEKTPSEFSAGIHYVQNNQLKKAKQHFLSLGPAGHGSRAMHLYNFLSIIHFLSLEYQECEYYIKKGLESPERMVYLHFLGCKLYIERHAGVVGVAPMFGMSRSCEPPAGQRLRTPVRSIFENKVVLNKTLENTPYRQIRLFKKFCDEDVFMANVGRVSACFPDFSILSIYVHEGRLWLYDLHGITDVELDWGCVVDELRDIMDRNRQVLSRKAESDQEKKEWWMCRIGLDRRLGRLIDKVRRRFRIVPKEKVLLILDENTTCFPFEQVFGKVSYRVRSLENLFTGAGRMSGCPDAAGGPGRTCAKSGNRGEKLFYLLDADNNLSDTRECILEFFRQAVHPHVTGVDGRPLTARESSGLVNFDLFMYFGHGSGRKHFELRYLLPWATFLFGCSSCRLVCVPNFAYNGVLLGHLNRGRTVLGMLWDVTDKDLDRFTVGFLADFFGGEEIALSVRKNICRFRLRHLNGAAVVTYGFPYAFGPASSPGTNIK